jgi:FeS assembly SUF system protein
MTAKHHFSEDDIINVLKTVFDPEIPVNIYDLGLIYDIRISEDELVRVKMTLTSPNCPVAESLPVEVKDKIETIAGVKEADVEIVWDPSWNPNMMSEAAKLELGFL